MRIAVSSIFVDDQMEALRFYTDVLGFRRKSMTPLGEHYWLTVVSPEDDGGVELLLEPADHPAVSPFRSALLEDGIPAMQLAADDVETEHERLRDLGVHFTQQPAAIGNVVTAVFDDTCGNLVQLIARR